MHTSQVNSFPFPLALTSSFYGANATFLGPKYAASSTSSSMKSFLAGGIFLFPMLGLAPPQGSYSIFASFSSSGAYCIFWKSYCLYYSFLGILINCSCFTRIASKFSSPLNSEKLTPHLRHLGQLTLLIF